MKPVERSEIVDYQTYEELRPAARARAMEAKDARRIQLGTYLTVLFENRETVRYQVQEMMRTERIVREADIQHELTTYNELLGGPGELGCTLLVGIENAAERPELLTRWVDLPAHLYALLPDGERVRPTFDDRQVGDGRLSSVQYLKFPVRGQVPRALGCDLSGAACAGEVALTPLQQEALARDLG